MTVRRIRTETIEQRLQTEIMDTIRTAAQRLYFLSQPDERVDISHSGMKIDCLQAKWWDRYARRFMILE